MKTTTVSEFIQEKNKLQSDLDKAQRILRELTVKLDDLQSEIPGLREKQEQASKDKQRALDLFVTDRITEEEMNTAKQTFELIQNREREISELIEAIQRNIKITSAEIPKLSNLIFNAERKAWSCIYEDLKEEVRQIIGDMALQAWAAKLKTGSADLQHVCRDILQLSQLPNHEAVRQIQDDLAKKFNVGEIL